MAAPEGCPGVIVSANRANDIWPYATAIYAQDPDTWGCVFPWEFPQNGTREQEETFLRLFFSETEIYMQGGADGEGRGFRFLKQVWYTIAIWNLTVRVPAVEKWYWQQETSIMLLSDPQTTQFLVREDSTPSTYFEGKEMQMYGEKFLAHVVPRIRLTAREYLRRQQLGEDIDIITVSKKLAEDINEDLRTRNARSRPDENVTSPAVRKASDPPSKPDFSIEAPPPMTNGHGQDHPRHFSEGSNFNHEAQIRSQKRGRGNYRGITRGGHHHGRPTNPFEGQNFRNYSSPTGGPPAVPNQMMRTRDASGTHMGYMPPIPQGQQLPEIPYFMRSASQNQQFAPINMPPQNSQPYSAPYTGGQEPIYYSRNAYPDPDPAVFVERMNSGTLSRQIFDNNEARHGVRRNSMNGRGRGSFGSGRGRGSRGRNSFGASDQGMHGVREDDLHSNHPGSFNGNNYAGRGRRYSGLSENWRSGSGEFPPQAYAYGIKENVVPGSAFFGSGNADLPQNGPQMNMKPFLNQKSVHVPHTATNQSFPLQAVVQSPPSLIQQMDTGVGSFNETVTCSRDWISAHCTSATKLIAFDVPYGVPEDQLLTFFNKFGQVQGVTRLKAPPERKDTNRAFITFSNAQHARSFLDHTPIKWDEGHDVKVEVAKEFWDPAYYWRRRGSLNTSGPQWRRGSGGNQDMAVAPMILRRNENGSLGMGGINTPGSINRDPHTITEMPSEETTPCPSGSNTPKKKKNKNKNKSKAELMKNEVPRRLSSLPNAEQQFTAESSGENVMATASAPIADDLKPNVQPESSDALETGFAVGNDSTKMSRNASSPIATHAQSSTEPTHKPEHTIKTQGPVTEQPPADEPSAHDNARDQFYVAQDPGSTPAVHVPTNSSPDQQEDDKDVNAFRNQASTQKTAAETTSSAAKSSVMASGPANAARLSVHKRLQSHQTDESHCADRFYTVNTSNDGGDHTDVGPGALEDAKISDLEAPKNGVSPPFPTDDAAADKKGDEPVTDMAHGDNTPLPGTANTNSELSVQKTRVAIKIDTNATSVSDTEKRTTSGLALAPPTPAFVTAPNTPAVGFEFLSEYPKDKPQQVKQSEKHVAKQGEKQSEKTDKAKGPAQTESLSLFARKKDKKPKASKKGSINGKPGMSDKLSNAGSRSTSGVVSGITTPVVQDTTNQQDAKREDGGNQEKFGSAVASKLTAGNKRSKSKEEVKVHQPDETAENAAVTVQDSPNKRKGKLGNMLSGVSSFFGGGAQSQTPSQADSSTIPSSLDSTLTGSKAQDHLLENEIRETVVGTDVLDHAGEGDVAVPSMQEDEVAGEEEFGSSIADGQDFILFDDSPGGLSTGDMNEGQVDDILTEAQNKSDILASNVGTSKKKRKKGKNRQPTTPDNTAFLEPFIPVNETKPRMLRFGENEPAPKTLFDDVSQASSATQSGDLDRLSPAPMSTPGKKLPPANPNDDHILQPKRHPWMKKKRALTLLNTKTFDEEPEGEIETIREVNDSDTEESDDDNTPADSDLSSVRGRKIYVYIGPGRRSRMDADDDGFRSKEEMSELAKQELDRKFKGGELGVVESAE